MGDILRSHYEEIYGLIHWIYKAYAQDIISKSIFSNYCLLFIQLNS